MTITGQSPLIDTLKNDGWASIHAMPVQNRSNLYLDLVITSSSQSIRVTGKEVAIDADNETFALAFYEHKREGYWAQDSGWTPKHLNDVCGKGAVETLSEPPRDIRLFTSPLLQQIDSGAKHDFKCCVAIEFSKTIEHQRRVLMVAASQTEPFLVEFSIDESVCENYLEGLILMDNIRNAKIS